MEIHRQKIHSLLKQIVPNVYFQPPESVKLKFPAIVYSRESVRSNHADNNIYLYSTRYEAQLISKDPTGKYTDAILNLDYASYDRHYVKDGLHHDVFTIYI